MAFPELTINQVSDALDQVPDLDPSGIERLEPGAWSAAFAFSSDGRDLVVRFSFLREDFGRDAFASQFATPLVPIPAVMHLGEYESFHIAVSERRSGRFLDHLSGEEFGRTLPSLLATLNGLRTADTSGSSGYGTWDAESGIGLYSSWPKFLSETITDQPDDRGSGWRAKLEASSVGSAPFDRDAEVLIRASQGMPSFRNVLHSDLVNRNCFVKDFQISGIIDWGCAMYGDFLYDIAWFSFWAPWFPQWRHVDFLNEAKGFYENVGADMANVDERLACYELHIGLTHQAYYASLDNWTELARVTQYTSTIADRIR